MRAMVLDRKYSAEGWTPQTLEPLPQVRKVRHLEIPHY